LEAKRGSDGGEVAPGGFAALLKGSLVGIVVGIGPWPWDPVEGEGEVKARGTVRARARRVIYGTGGPL
jgi:hypothetical protein